MSNTELRSRRLRHGNTILIFIILYLFAFEVRRKPALLTENENEQILLTEINVSAWLFAESEKVSRESEGEVRLSFLRSLFIIILSSHFLSQ